MGVLGSNDRSRLANEEAVKGWEEVPGTGAAEGTETAEGTEAEEGIGAGEGEEEEEVSSSLEESPRSSGKR